MAPDVARLMKEPTYTLVIKDDSLFQSSGSALPKVKNLCEPQQ
jgi:hypothetical protein